MNKPLDKLFEKMDSAKDKFFKDMDKALPKEVTYVSRLESEVKQLKHIAKGYRFETATLKEEIIDLKERIKDDDDLYEIYQDLKQENATLKKSLSKAGELIEEQKKANEMLRSMLKVSQDSTKEIIDKYKELRNLCSKEQLAELDYIAKREVER